MKPIQKNNIKKQKRPSIALRVRSPNIPQSNNHINAADEVHQAILQNRQQILKQQKQMGILLRVNRLMIDSQQIYKNFNVPIRQGKILLKIFDQILTQMEDLETQQIVFDHRKLYKYLFQTQVEQSDPHMSVDSLQSTRPQRTWKVSIIKQQIKQAKKNVLLQQINFIVSRNQFNTFIVYQKLPPSVPSNQRISILSSLKRLSDHAKGRSSILSIKNNFLKITNIEDKDDRSRSSSIRSKSSKNGQIQKINYKITWNNKKKEYNKLFRSQQSNEQYRFIDSLNSIVKNKIQTKQQTSLKQSIQQNISFILPILILVTVGLLIILIFNDVTFILIALSIITIILIYFLYKFSNIEIYCNQKYRQQINQILLQRFQSSQSNFILELSQDSLDIKVLQKNIL